MGKYSTIFTSNGFAEGTIIKTSDGKYFGGYDFMGSINWNDSTYDAVLMDQDEAEQIIADLESADEIDDLPRLKDYEILVLDDHSNIIHRHYFSCCYKDDAYNHAMDSRKKYGGSEWKVIEIKGNLVDYMNQQAETRERKLQKKLWDCLKKALANEKEYGCHLRDIAMHLGRSIESKETYYDTLIDVWCDYFLKHGEEE